MNSLYSCRITPRSRRRFYTSPNSVLRFPTIRVVTSLPAKEAMDAPVICVNTGEAEDLKFSYSPGMDSFPAIYIRDGSSGIQYELEDMDGIKDNCLLDRKSVV